MREADVLAPEIDWTRAAVIGALAGGAFWAIAVFVLFSSQGAAAAWTAVGGVAVMMLAIGRFLYRRAASAERRCYGMGLILAPLTGVVPAAVFLLAGVTTEFGTSI
ncbi:hypothetical protein [Mycolicibacterium vanbaalenii]|uniref:hypothetical protein n=1 Tax=Mycolicibacterium vanbaalenii TaxID=110539 RepID=UPI001330EAB1|nr:hypothetical protein [Mycolicibacterium vanbaalenii]